MGEALCILSVADVIAVIICIGIAKKELKKTERERLHNQIEASKKRELELLEEALSYTEEEEDE